MPGVLPEDKLDYERATARLERVLDRSNPMYRCAVEVARRTNRANSCATYVGALVRFFTWARDHGVDAVTATSDDISDWFATLRQYSPSTRQLAVTVVRLLYEEAVERDLVARSPARKLRARRPADDESPPALTGPEANALLQAIRAEMGDPKRRVQAHRDYIAVYLLLMLGLRAAELRRLTFGDFDAQGRRPTVVVRRKGGSLDRLPVPASIGEQVASWRTTLADVGISVAETDPVICQVGQPSRHGLGIPVPLRQVSNTRLYLVVRSWLEVVGITGSKVGPHRLRRTAATLAWEGHADLPSIQAMLGHRDPETTVRHYIRPAEELRRSASDHIRLTA